MIGWAYLVNAALYLVVGDRLVLIFVACGFLYLLNVNEFVTPFGFLTRPVWGISKIRATPSWTAICAGIN
ncbi:hypothetical protein JW935_12575, partial [candidate division KSB1 bacterium]|nr:hypothetical protein [candidate division KSB1 bacterium]